MTEEELKEIVIKLWEDNKDLFDNYYTKDITRGLGADFYDAFEAYANSLVCPYCNVQNVEVFYEDELEQGDNRWRLQCQNCGLETPQEHNALRVIDVWDKFNKIFGEEND